MMPFFRRAVPVLITLICFLIISCGKKGEPTLKSYEKPQPPVLLSVMHREATITLMWSYNKAKESAISGYAILRSDGSGFEKIGNTDAGVRTYMDATFSVGKAVSYKIVAITNRGVLSDASNSISLTPQMPSAPPKNLLLTVSDDNVILSWDDAGKDISYNVYKSINRGTYGVEPLNSSPLRATSFTDGLDVSRPSFYAVRSCFNGTTRDEGPLSHEVVFDPAELVPSAPADLKFFAAEDRVFLYWKEPKESWLTGFDIFKKTPDGEYERIGHTHIPSFIDKASPDSERDYRVHAVGPVKRGPGTEIKGVKFIPER